MKTLLAALLFVTAVPVAAEPARWAIDYGASRIAFTAEQTQAPFDGQFRKFEADVRFDPAALASSSADVTIDVGSVTTDDDERDGILRGVGWFEASANPTAHFVAKQFAATKDGFEARGDLTIRSTTRPVTLTFTVKDANGRRELHGETTLDRLAFGLGLGEWADPKYIGTSVRVTVTLVAKTTQ